MYPTLEEARRISKGYKRIPIALEVLSDTHTPIHLFLSVQAKYDKCFLLESAQNGEQWGRYSFIGFAPKAEIQFKNGQMTVSGDLGVTTQALQNPIAYIQQVIEQYKSPVVLNLPRLTGGLVGYFAYDTVRYIEPKLCRPPTDDLQMPDGHFLLCDEIIAFDHLRHKTLIIVNVPTQGDFDANYAAAQSRAKQIAAEMLVSSCGTATKSAQGEMQISSNITRDDFMGMVQKAKEYIRNGDIFQVVLSQRFEVDNPPDAFDTYRMLRAGNPSPYMYFFRLGDISIAGASPEMLLSAQDGVIATRPIAGTIRRGIDEAQDLQLENRLLSDPKEQAEHTMLVDLGRNDLGKVSQFGSVEVTQFMKVERYSQVMHLVSDVKGRLCHDKTALDALMAVLPAGTLSGAPKVRAMKIIDELESRQRGLYGGTVGYLGFDGNLDTCIAIRTVLYTHGKAYVQTGAGIVADSVAENEFEETQSKAKAMLKALQEARDLS